MGSRQVAIALLLATFIAPLAAAAPLVYTGYDVVVAKEPFADFELPENQDAILPDIVITRAEVQGIFNIAQEGAYVDSLSPAGTTWAFMFNNPGKTLAATNWAALQFADWKTATGGPGGGPPATVGQDAVLHLVDQNIYLDIHFTAWSVNADGGGFAYTRAQITPSADFDRNGKVDGDDFLTWQRNFGLTAALQSQGDADFDGVVTADDLVVWQESFGSPLTTIAAVPEPNGLFLAAVALLGMILLTRK